MNNYMTTILVIGGCLLWGTFVSAHELPSGKDGCIDRSVAAIQKKDGPKAALDFVDAVKVNIRPECYDLLVPILAAVRYAENGRAGREYGVLHPKALGKNYRTQAGWAAATVQKQFDRYCKAGGKSNDVAAYLISLRDRYCPIGAANDPTNLNEHWLKNVSKFRLRFVKGRK